jgi:hypothetical protein
MPDLLAWLRPAPPPPLVGVAVAPTDVSDSRGTSGEGWQIEAWRVWHTLGEIHYPTSQESRLVSRVDWTTEPEVDLDALFSPPGVSELSRQIALNLYVAGEGWLVKTNRTPDDKPTDEHWRVESVGNTSSATTAKLERAAVTVRFWNPDPTDTSKADSAVRAALGPANELITLQSLSRTQARSRLARAGILLRPSSRQPMLDEDGMPLDFNTMLTEAMISAITDEDSAAAVVPIDITWPADEIEQWRHLTFDFPFDDSIDGKMERAIRRIALALDIWPELLLGIADINHWGSWFLAEDTWRGHIAPVAEMVAGTLEVAAVQVGTETEITPDPSVLLARRSTVADALDAAKIGAVGLEFVRDAIGAEDEDAPTDEDLETIAMLLGKKAPEEEEEEEVEQAAPATLPGQEEEEEPIAAAAGDVTGDSLGVAMARIDDQLRSWLDGAVEPTIMLARGRVGMQARTKLRGDPRQAKIDNVQNSDVGHYLGADALMDLLDVPLTVRNTVGPLAERWMLRLERSQAAIEDLIGDVIGDEAWELARKASGEALVDDLTEYIVTTIGLTDAAMGVFDGRRVVAVAGID